jgi:hypothetical protein
VEGAFHHRGRDRSVLPDGKPEDARWLSSRSARGGRHPGPGEAGGGGPRASGRRWPPFHLGLSLVCSLMVWCLSRQVPRPTSSRTPGAGQVITMASQGMQLAPQRWRRRQIRRVAVRGYAVSIPFKGGVTMLAIARHSTSTTSANSRGGACGLMALDWRWRLWHRLAGGMTGRAHGGGLCTAAIGWLHRLPCSGRFHHGC